MFPEISTNLSPRPSISRAFTNVDLRMVRSAALLVFLQTLQFARLIFQPRSRVYSFYQIFARNSGAFHIGAPSLMPKAP